MSDKHKELVKEVLTAISSGRSVWLGNGKTWTEAKHTMSIGEIMKRIKEGGKAWLDSNPYHKAGLEATEKPLSEIVQEMRELSAFQAEEIIARKTDSKDGPDDKTRRKQAMARTAMLWIFEGNAYIRASKAGQILSDYFADHPRTPVLSHSSDPICTHPNGTTTCPDCGRDVRRHNGRYRCHCGWMWKVPEWPKPEVCDHCGQELP